MKKTIAGLSACLCLLAILHFRTQASDSGTIPTDSAFYLPAAYRNDPPTPTATALPTATPTVTPTPVPATFDIDPQLVALSSSDVPTGYGMRKDEKIGPYSQDQGLVSGWVRWFRSGGIDIESYVREYTSELKATEGHTRIQSYILNDDFYDSCTMSERSAPLVTMSLITYSAIHCTRRGDDRLIYFSVYKNIVLDVEYGRIGLDVAVNKACEALMANRVIGGTVSEDCKNLLPTSK